MTLDAWWTCMESPIGSLTLVASDDGMREVMFDRPRDDQQSRRDDHPLLGAARAELDAYFAGTLTRFQVPLAPRGTPFQRACWDALMAIPYGETRSYGQQAAALGDVKKARAVGTANGQNPLAILVPCHRVVAGDGGLGGYAGGLHIKRHLLALEQRVSGKTPWTLPFGMGDSNDRV